MKLPIITDTHFGIKNGSSVFLDYQEAFLRDDFFPFCVKHGYTEILHLGDFFDNRKFLGVKTIKFAREKFIDQLREFGIHMHIIPGNHDVAYKCSNSISSVTEILDRHSDVITIHKDPTEVEFDGTKILFIPWMNNENEKDCMNAIATSSAKVLCGHFDMVGFDMIKGVSKSTHGLDRAVFERYEMVLSGHYHTKSSRANVHYLGVPYEQNWGDCGDPKFFHTLDTKAIKLKPIRNKRILFHKIFYDETSPPIIEDNLSGTFVRVVVSNKRDTNSFEKFIDSITHQHPFDLKIIENYESMEGANVGDEGLDIADTYSLLNTYVDSVETNLDREKLKSIMNSLLLEAQQTEAL